MGKTSKPLLLLVSDELAGIEPFLTWRAQGHQIDVMDSVLSAYDGIFSSNAQLMTPAHIPYAESAKTRLQKLKYPPKVKVTK